MTYKPDGYPAAIPYLILPNAAEAIDFLVQAFDAEEIRRFPMPTGERIMHAEVRIGDGVLMIADANDDWPPIAGHVYLYLPDVDAAYARALALGAESLGAPVQKDDEDKRGGVMDASGTTWWIATRTAS
jgi:uncharacterized glyoxalase superfamily protein PhnB